jgi:F-type H+-transporting ATPase subunit delta
LVAAKQLNDDEVNKIKNELSKDFTNKVKLDYKYDPSLIGGLIIQVGSVMIDTSIKSKLKQLENKMIGA